MNGGNHNTEVNLIEGAVGEIPECGLIKGHTIFLELFRDVPAAERLDEKFAGIAILAKDRVQAKSGPRNSVLWFNDQELIPGLKVGEDEVVSACLDGSVFAFPTGSSDPRNFNFSTFQPLRAGRPGLPRDETGPTQRHGGTPRRERHGRVVRPIRFPPVHGFPERARKLPVTPPGPPPARPPRGRVRHGVMQRTSAKPR